MAWAFARASPSSSRLRQADLWQGFSFSNDAHPSGAVSTASKISAHSKRFGSGLLFAVQALDCTSARILDLTVEKVYQNLKGGQRIEGMEF